MVDRESNRHAAFGLGIHRCLGSNLARLELRVALEEWIAAFPRFRVVDPAAVTWTLGHVRGPHAVDVEILRATDMAAERKDPTFLLGVDGVTELVLVRHAKQAQRDDFLGHAVGELHDPPLAELGQRQAKAVAALLAGEGLDAVYASRSQRAGDTAAAIAAASGLEVTVVDGIEEFGFFRDLPDDHDPAGVAG